MWAFPLVYIQAQIANTWRWVMVKGNKDWLHESHWLWSMQTCTSAFGRSCSVRQAYVYVSQDDAQCTTFRVIFATLWLMPSSRHQYRPLYTPHKILIIAYSWVLEFLSRIGDNNTFVKWSLLNPINVAQKENPILNPQSGLYKESGQSSLFVYIDCQQVLSCFPGRRFWFNI